MHVAVDTSSKGATGGINGPIFSDNSFEFIPIPENPNNTTETRTYSTLKSKNTEHGNFISDFVPSDIQNYLVHFDPDFENFTYADPSDMKKSKRGGMLKKLSIGDYIFFVASLVPFKKSAYVNNDRKEICKYQKGKMAKYLIGYFEIKNILQFEKTKNNLKNRIKKHNSSKGAKFTRGKKWKLLYKKKFSSKKEAMKYEYLLKKDKIKRVELKKRY